MITSNTINPVSVRAVDVLRFSSDGNALYDPSDLLPGKATECKMLSLYAMNISYCFIELHYFFCGHYEAPSPCSRMIFSRF